MPGNLVLLENVPAIPRPSVGEPMGWQYRLNPALLGELCLDMDRMRLLTGLAGLHTVTVNEFAGQSVGTPAGELPEDMVIPDILEIPRTPLYQVSFWGNDSATERRHALISINPDEADQAIAKRVSLEHMSDFQNNAERAAWRVVIGGAVTRGIYDAARMRRREAVSQRPSKLALARLYWNHLAGGLIRVHIEDQPYLGDYPSDTL